MDNQVEEIREKSTDTIVLDEIFEDKLDRKKLAKNFVSVLSSQNANVFSINGSWGSGKTWFLKFIEDECQEQKIPFVKFNVWENDYLNDPFSAIIAELSTLLDFSDDQIKELVSKVTLNASVGFMGNNIGFQYDPTKNISEYKKLKREKEEFIKLLNKKIKKQTVVAIDELDRCRPDYAIKTLEVIKHFFHVPNIKFILAVDKEQLARTVKCMFGQETNTDCYLRKFVDIEYNLPMPNEASFIENLFVKKHKNILDKIKACKNKHAFLTKNDAGQYVFEYFNDKRLINQFVTHFKKFNYELRDIEKFFIKLEVTLNLFIFDDDINSDILVLDILLPLLTLYVSYPEIYNKLGKDSGLYSLLSEKQKEIIRNYNLEPLARSERQYFLKENIDRESIPNDINILRSANNIHKYFEKINLSEGFE